MHHMNRKSYSRATAPYSGTATSWKGRACQRKNHLCRSMPYRNHPQVVVGDPVGACHVGGTATGQEYQPPEGVEWN
eukprot:3449356-Pyramimonas_sp.AAC.1